MASLQTYAQRGETDAEWRRLLARADGGDQAAVGQLHDVLFEELWGGVLDKAQLGFGVGGQGVKEPEATARLREWVRTQEPALWAMMTMEGEDPFIEQYVYLGVGRGGWVRGWMGM